jgi:hypothetical protein
VFLEHYVTEVVAPRHVNAVKAVLSLK